MFRDSTTFSSELSAAEQTAFEALVHAIGFAREVKFGRGNEARVLRDFAGPLVYALTPVDHIGPRAVHEYRLFVAVASANGSAPTQRRHPPKARASAGTREPTVKRGTPEFKAKMQAMGRAHWRKRVKKYGPIGCRPGKEPWKMP